MGCNVRVDFMQPNLPVKIDKYIHFAPQSTSNLQSNGIQFPAHCTANR